MQFALFCAQKRSSFQAVSLRNYRFFFSFINIRLAFLCFQTLVGIHKIVKIANKQHATNEMLRFFSVIEFSRQTRNSCVTSFQFDRFPISLLVVMQCHYFTHREQNKVKKLPKPAIKFTSIATGIFFLCSLLLPRWPNTARGTKNLIASSRRRFMFWRQSIISIRTKKLFFTVDPFFDTNSNSNGRSFSSSSTIHGIHWRIPRRHRIREPDSNATHTHTRTISQPIRLQTQRKLTTNHCDISCCSGLSAWIRHGSFILSFVRSAKRALVCVSVRVRYGRRGNVCVARIGTLASTRSY